MLKGKAALVTGSTSGIGLGIAICLAREGANIVLNGFGETEAAQAKVREFGTKVGYHGADMSKPEEIEAMMAYAESEFGGVDVLVNNAGIQHVAAIEDFETARWDAIIAINLSSSFHTTRLAIPGMRKKNWGRVLNIASVHGLVASAQKSAYIAAKHGLVGLTKTVALETATTGITVNAICPGSTDTGRWTELVEITAREKKLSIEAATKHLVADVPMGRVVVPDDIAGLAVYLASEQAGMITGTAINVDGGRTRGIP